MNDEVLLEITAQITSAYVSKNPVPASGLPALIATISASLQTLGKPVEPEQRLQPPAVKPNKSVFPDYIISLEDGGRYKSLKRHLSSKYGLTPAEYRVKWGLPADYPMVAPNYAAARSAMAKAFGLGRKPEPKAPEKAAPRARTKRPRPI